MTNTCFAVSKSFQTWSEESEGEYIDQGYIYQGDLLTLSEVIDELREYAALSDFGVVSPWTYAVSETEINFRTGEYTSYNLHIRTPKGEPLDADTLRGIYRKAKLLK